MDGADLAEALYARMRWNMPLSLEHADLLMKRLDLRPGLRMADIGCGWGELLLQAASRTMGSAADADADAGQVSCFGVDEDAAALARALARERWNSSATRSCGCLTCWRQAGRRAGG